MTDLTALRDARRYIALASEMGGDVFQAYCLGQAEAYLAQQRAAGWVFARERGYFDFKLVDLVSKRVGREAFGEILAEIDKTLESAEKVAA